jgi:periplasmic mercuric ion binding protein
MNSRPKLLAAIGITLLLGSACVTKDPSPAARTSVSPKSAVSEKKEPPVQRTILSMSGTYCEFYLVDVEAAISDVPGVKDVDLTTMQGHAIVTYVAGKMNPNHLLAAVRSVKGDGYRCKAEIEKDGVGGKVVRY